MSALPPDAWVPVPLRWRHVIPGDLVLAKDGAPWLIWDADGETWFACSAQPRPDHVAQPVVPDQRCYSHRPDPDDVIQVLVPVTEADALALTREELGARLIERRVGLSAGGEAA